METNSINNKKTSNTRNLNTSTPDENRKKIFYTTISNSKILETSNINRSLILIC